MGPATYRNTASMMKISIDFMFRLYISDEEGNMITSTDRFGKNQKLVTRGGRFTLYVYLFVRTQSKILFKHGPRLIVTCLVVISSNPYNICANNRLNNHAFMRHNNL